MHNKTWSLNVGSQRWLAMRLDIICFCFIAAVLLISIFTQSGAGQLTTET